MSLGKCGLDYTVGIKCMYGLVSASITVGGCGVQAVGCWSPFIKSAEKLVT